MNKKGTFKLPDADARLHLYPVGAGLADRTGVAWTPFEVDLFADEDEVYVCDSCKRKAVVGWVTEAGKVACPACAVAHTEPYEPCVLFHKFSRRCWSEIDDGKFTVSTWVEEREKAVVYRTPAEAEASRGLFLAVVQKAILVVPVEKFDEVLAKYKENL